MTRYTICAGIRFSPALLKALHFAILIAVLLFSSPLLAQVRVQITPSSVTLPTTGRQAFTAVVTGVNNPTVKWSLVSGPGEIDEATGEYFAPRDPQCEAERVRVRATSEQDPNVFATATISLPEVNDCRGNFEGSFYVGLGVDTFAAGEVRRYLNPDDANRTAERGVGGFDFGYRLWRNDPESTRSRQLWVYGETIHGVRSADIDCKKEENKAFAICKNDPSLQDIGQDPAGQLLKIIRNASSLEAYTGARFEFGRLNTGGRDVANLYVKAQAGFLKVSHVPGDAIDMHQVSVGALATNGKFQGSYLDLGIGRTDLFANQGTSTKGSWNRKKIDGYLSTNVGRGVRFFTQIVADLDFGPGSDSVQTYFGFEFDLKRFNFSALAR